MDQVLRSRLTTARLERGAVLLDRSGSGRRVRIPLTAIETVRPRGASARRGIEIVLTAGPGESDPAVYRLRPSSATAAAAFADTVNSALPVRDAAERRRSGRVSVTQEPKPARARRPGRARSPWVWLGGLFALGACLGAASGAWGLVLVWAASFPVFCVGFVLTRLVWLATEDWWLLRRRGITVVATYERTDYGRDSDGDSTYTKVYVFEDGGGARREHRGGGRRVGTDPERIEVTYDPVAEDRVSARYGLVARALMCLAYVVLGLPVCLLTAAYPVVLLSATIAASPYP
ncbi:hypothetical protein [Streptomyces sp. SID8379]|uniref:hypothetical protein n=1 Tax=Streptomyces sp. SID8379 TaxID=2690359 RepID=UPI00036281F8|nr:hypothetical protein [Streptomyces sp. SID8379]